MKLRDRHVVITGAGSGIGRALAHRFAREAPRGLVVADRDADAVARTAAETGALAVHADVGREAGVLELIAAAEAAHGEIDLFCSNAGVAGPAAGAEAPDAAWDLLWRVNVLAHVWAARALVPKMRARGEGYLLNTVSAAGLLMSPGQMPYSATKHAALSVADHLAVDHGEAGVRVSVFCPQVVETPMFAAFAQAPTGRALARTGAAISPDEAAEIVLAGVREERFLILSHDEVRTYAERRAADHDRWIGGMRRLRRTAAEAASSG